MTPYNADFILPLGAYQAVRSWVRQDVHHRERATGAARQQAHAAWGGAQTAQEHDPAVRGQGHRVRARHGDQYAESRGSHQEWRTKGEDCSANDTLNS